jgi:HK97 family phage major capsid protein
MLERAQRALQDALTARAAAQTNLMNLRSQDNLSETDVAAATQARDAATTVVTERQADVARAQAEVDEEARISALTAQVRDTAPAPRPIGGARVTSEAPVYRRGDHSVSYFRDLMRAQTRTGNGIAEAGERLIRNSRQFTDDLRNAPEVQQRALTTVDGAGGDFVPPLWLINQFIELARPGRVTADLTNQQALPPGTDTISLPRVATGTATAQQATQNTAIQNTDATTNSVSAAVLTIAGGQTMAQQLLDQSPINMDEILLGDLAADYAVKADVFVLTNNATNAVGLFNAAGQNVTYTTGSPTAALLYSKIAGAIQQIHTTRYMPPNVIVMHPRRWAYFLAALDTVGRPLVTPYAGGQNPIATQSGVLPAGAVGSLQGLPVYTDPNIQTNLGAGTNQDPIYLMRTNDIIFYESTPRAEASIQPGFMSLSVNLRFFRYVAIHASRYVNAIAVINGTGMVAPAF